MGRSYACASGAYIQRPREFNEFQALSVRSAQKNRNLNADSWRGPGPCRSHGGALFELFEMQIQPHSTWALVRRMQFSCQLLPEELGVVIFIINRLHGRQKMARLKGKLVRGTIPTGFPKMCKWNAFAIDRQLRVWKDERIAMGKVFPLLMGTRLE